MDKQGTFAIEIQGLDELMARFEQAPNLMEKTMQQAIVKASGILASNTDPSTVPFRTGNLIRSFNPPDIGRLFARWYPRAEYAPYLQFGTSKGIKPRRFMEAIRSKSKPDIDKLFANALAYVVRTMAGGDAAATQGGLVNLLDPMSSGSIAGTSGTTSAFSSALYKVAPKFAAKFDQLTYRPFKGAPRGYQARLGQKFPRLFKKWNISNM